MHEDQAYADPRTAWTPYEPDARRPWTLAMAGHLFRRAAFGATWTELQRALGDGPAAAVDRLLRPEGDLAAFHREYDEYDAGAAGGVEARRAWWLRRMIHSPHPLLERMTFFWHDFFGVGASRVGDAALMAQHIALLRRHALGSFAQLLKAVARDPATLVALGAEANRKARPNEHLARTLLERYSLGPGNFSDADVREVARAFTGWFVLRSELRYFEREHDGEDKRILSREGRFDDQQAVAVLLAQRATARTVVRRLYRCLVSETDEPDEALLAPLVESFAEDYDVARLVETMLRSRRFFSAAAYRQRVKGPVELAVGLARGLEASIPTAPLGRALAGLGQNLLDPPTGEGWAGGRHWINRATLVGRHNLTAAMLSAREPYGPSVDPAALAARHGRAQADAAATFLVELLLQGDVGDARIEAVRKALPTDRGDPAAGVRAWAAALAALPEYQMA